MTVNELIARLVRLNQDSEITIASHSEYAELGLEESLQGEYYFFDASNTGPGTYNLLSPEDGV